MRARLPLLLLLIALAAPATASALTVGDIVALTKAGVSDPVILALISRDKPIFTIAPDDLITLKDAGVSETVVLAMLRSGRDEAPRQPPAETVVPPPTEPTVITYGTGPDRPNAAPDDSGVTYATPYAVPYIVAVAVPAHPFRSRRFNRDVSQTPLTVLVGPQTLAPVPPQRPFVPTTGIFFQGPTPRGIFFGPPPRDPR